MVMAMVFNATFNNISAISWQSVLLVEKIEASIENHQTAATRCFKRELIFHLSNAQ
jgi:hypothetical protein